MTTRFEHECRFLGVAADEGWRIRFDVLERVQNLIVLAQRGRIGYVNTVGLRWLGFDRPEDVIGREFRDILHHDYAELASLGLDVLAEERMIPVKLLRRDASDIEAEMYVNPLLGQDEAPNGEDIYIVEARDIGEHLKSARALRAREQWLEGIINTVADGIVTVDHRGRVQSFNPAAERIFHFTADEVIGKSIRELIPEPIAQQIEGPEGAELTQIAQLADEVMGKRKDGAVFPMEITVSEMQQGDTVAYTSVVRDITARKRAEEKIRHLAHHDHLTGLPNRFLFADRLEEAINRAVRHHQRLALMFIDLNRFKPINDTYGHAVGDRVLMGIGSRLRSALRKTDTVARIGGDEFVAVLEEISGEKEVRMLAAKIMGAVAAPELIDGRLHSVDASLGISLFPDDAYSSVELMDLADKAMYLAKREGGTFACLYPDRLWKVEAEEP
jgi:diguanylate cyclase (GGDEF)-like protein/PAS domain S-box-containing protein